MEMKAGRELDALVAEKVMGCKIVWPPSPLEAGLDQAEYERRRRLNPDPTCGCEEGSHLFCADDGGARLMQYSSSIEAAWEVVGKMTARPGFELDCQITPATGSNGLEWYCNFGDSRHGEYGKTAPLAICLAALKAVGA